MGIERNDVTDARGCVRTGSKIRIAGFHVEPEAYQMVAAWAAARGHELTLVVTTPGPDHTTYDGHNAIVEMAPRDQDVLVTTRLKRAAAAIAAYAPNIILSYTFPYRIPAAILAIPRLGAVNLHPSPLPRYRGPNPHRMLYDGAPTLGATLHRTEAGFDTGAILSLQEAPVPPDPCVESVQAAWDAVLLLALDDGMARVTAGEPGTPQDDADASYAASYTDEESWLDWNWPVETLVRRTVALNLVQPQARAVLHGEMVTVLAVRPDAALMPATEPGTVLGRTSGGYLVAAGDGAVDVDLGPGETIAVQDMDRFLETAGSGMCILAD